MRYGPRAYRLALLEAGHARENVLLAVKPGGSGDVTATARVWREERAKKNRCGAGVSAGGYLYLANMEGFVECIEAKTGNMLWSERLPAKGPKSESWSSMVLSGDSQPLRGFMSQSPKPGSQPGLQTLASHASAPWSFVHMTPQPPQLATSARVFLQLPVQHAWPVVLQAAPHAPQ